MWVCVFPTSTTSNIRAPPPAAAPPGAPPGPSIRSSASAARPRPGTSSSGASSSSGTSTNRRVVTSRCGRVSRSDEYDRLAEQQHVDVDRPRPVLDVAVLAGLRAPERALHRLARVEQRLWPQRASRSAGTRCRTAAGREPRRPAPSRTPTTRPARRRRAPTRTRPSPAGDPPIADVGAQPEIADLTHARGTSRARASPSR